MPLPLQLPAPTGADRVPRTLALTPIALSLMLWSTGASAQSTTSFKEQYKLIKAPGAVAAIGSDLFGDKVNMYTGGLEFVQTDAALQVILKEDHPRAPVPVLAIAGEGLG